MRQPKFKVGDKVMFKLDEIVAIQSRDGVINRKGTIMMLPDRQINYLVQDDHIGCNDIHIMKENWWINESKIKLDNQYYREKALNELGI